MKKRCEQIFSEKWLFLFTEGYAGAEDVIKMNHLDATSATFLL